jgi:hypothetical protein
VLELKEGDSLFVPSFTWIQVQWKESGIALHHYGYAEMLTTNQLQSIMTMDDIVKLIFKGYNQLIEPYRGMFLRRWLSIGRHPRKELPGSPV